MSSNHWRGAAGQCIDGIVGKGLGTDPGPSMLPADVTLQTVAAAQENGDFTTSMSARGRWRVRVTATATNANQVYGADLMIEGDNGNTFPIWGVNHIAYAGSWFYFWPVDTNAEYKASMLSDFNSLFPVGTTLVVKQGRAGNLCHTNLEQGWMKLDLGSAKPIVSLKLWQVKDYAHNRFGAHTVATSTTSLDGPWTTCFTGSLPSTYGPHIEACQATARFVKIELDGHEAFMHLEEVQVLASESNVAGAGEFHCNGLQAYDSAYGAQYPVRVVKDGRFLANVDMLGLRFTKNGTTNTDIQGYFEIHVWPQCISFSADLSHGDGTAGFSAAFGVALDGGAGQSSIVTVAPNSGSTAKLSLQFCVDDTGQLTYVSPEQPSAPPLEIGLACPAGDDETQATRVCGDLATYNRTQGSWVMTLPASGNKAFPADLDAVDKYDMHLSNPTGASATVNLEFLRPSGQRNIVGIAPMLFVDGIPSGIPLQVSKNWHEAWPAAWLSVSTVLELPAGSSKLQLRIAYAHWGGLPSVSHAQLSLIGWGGGHGVWHESALGSFGESVCYQPDGQSKRSMVTDVRPQSVCNMQSTATDCKKYVIGETSLTCPLRVQALTTSCVHVLPVQIPMDRERGRRQLHAVFQQHGVAAVYEAAEEHVARWDWALPE